MIETNNVTTTQSKPIREPNQHPKMVDYGLLSMLIIITFVSFYSSYKLS